MTDNQSEPGPEAADDQSPSPSRRARPRPVQRKGAKKAAPKAAAKREATPTRDRLLNAARAEFAQHGFAGARVERILAKAGSNPRMLYHHFGSKSALYVAVLEEALVDLRLRELRLDVDDSDPLDGLLQLFDFMHGHFESNPSFVSLMTNENLLKGRFIRKSARIREMSSPVLDMIARFLARGTESGKVAPGLDPLRIYVLMVALCQFHLSNAYTLSVMFNHDLTSREWRAARKRDARQMMKSFLEGGQERHLPA